MTKTATIRLNQAKTAWLVISGSASALCGALVIENFCATKKSALAWCAANGFSVVA